MLQISTNRIGCASAVPAEQIRQSFRIKFSSYCNILSSSRAIHIGSINTYSSQILSPFEQELYLDYLISALNLADKISHRFEIKKLSDENQLLGDYIDTGLYHDLRRAYKKQDFLYWKIEDLSPGRQKRGTFSPISVYQSDIPYLEYYHHGKRKFPWQRNSQVTDPHKYSFNILGQRFESSRIDSAREFKYVELLDWYLREKYFGINLATVVSSYAPGISKKLINYARQEAFWNEATSDKGFLIRLMEIPYPAYRLSFVQLFLKWYFMDDTSEDFKDSLCVSSLSYLIELIGKLPPKSSTACYNFDIPNGLESIATWKPQSLPDEITMETIDELMNRAVMISILSFMSIYKRIESLSMQQIMETLEDDYFWRKCKSVVYDLITSEIEKYNNGANFSVIDQRFPLILIPFSDSHGNRLLETLGSDSRISDIHSTSYSAIQKVCYQLGQKLNSTAN